MELSKAYIEVPRLSNISIRSNSYGSVSTYFTSPFFSLSMSTCMPSYLFVSYCDWGVVYEDVTYPRSAYR
jgi:hypothetical protein